MATHQTLQYDATGRLVDMDCPCGADHGPSTDEERRWLLQENADLRAQLATPPEVVADPRGEPQEMTLRPGHRYQFRGVFVVENATELPADIVWSRVVDDPFERDLADREELDRLRREVADLRTVADKALAWRRTGKMSAQIELTRAVDALPTPDSA